MSHTWLETHPLIETGALLCQKTFLNISQCTFVFAAQNCMCYKWAGLFEVINKETWLNKKVNMCLILEENKILKAQLATKKNCNWQYAFCVRFVFCNTSKWSKTNSYSQWCHKDTCCKDSHLQSQISVEFCLELSVSVTARWKGNFNTASRVKFPSFG